MTGTAPFTRGLMCDFFWHLENEMDWRALAKGQIRCEGYFEVESLGKASFGSNHGNDILPC